MQSNVFCLINEDGRISCILGKPEDPKSFAIIFQLCLGIPKSLDSLFRFIPKSNLALGTAKLLKTCLRPLIHFLLTFSMEQYTTSNFCSLNKRQDVENGIHNAKSLFLMTVVIVIERVLWTRGSGM